MKSVILICTFMALAAASSDPTETMTEHLLSEENLI
jgi:hypothetical protein